MEDLPYEPGFDGAMRRCAVTTDAALMTFVWMEPSMSERRPEHSHPFDQAVYVVAGVMELFLGEDREPLLLGPGDVAYVPRDQVHSARVVGDERVHAVEVFAPIRTDYLHAARDQIEAAARAQA